MRSPSNVNSVTTALFDRIILDFLKNHKVLLRGKTNEKEKVVSLWEDLKASLNSSGGPVEDAEAWKKVSFFLFY